MKVREETDEVLEAAAKSIHGPRHDHVDAWAGGVLRQGIERGPLVARRPQSRW
jgi:hypothetical protein